MDSPRKSPPGSGFIQSVPYRSQMEAYGSTCFIKPVRPGIVVKEPIQFKQQGLADKVTRSFSVEPLILERLGRHPRIVKYHGLCERGILLGEATHGDLQTYIDDNPSITPDQRLEWCRQAAEAIAYIHKCGIVHSDLRPKNFLVHETRKGSLDLLLCDFGGATCAELDLDGGCLPDGPFYNPVFGIESVPALDIFGLGSLFYTIVTGHWPYRSSTHPFSTIDEKIRYEREVQGRIKEKTFPDVASLLGGDVMLGCWMMKFTSADEVLNALDRAGRVSNLVDGPSHSAQQILIASRS
ncbi:hypothetical protein CEP51_004679 [Fusarium floridanum]|uniref:EKC/KEOPS complex subunit BUD32 n=1 Tax=Fusarium floridanum TaxID=1325733 RepID=A0A428RZX0_9HYPO|nr:hypothetical protein CEP51_004679 [Fusarium floridanum]